MCVFPRLPKSLGGPGHGLCLEFVCSSLVTINPRGPYLIKNSPLCFSLCGGDETECENFVC